MIFNTSINDLSALEFEEENSCLSIQSQFEDNEQNFQTILWWTNAVCLPIIAVIGLFCNGLNILVLVSTELARRMPSWYILKVFSFDRFYVDLLGLGIFSIKSSFSPDRVFFEPYSMPDLIFRTGPPTLFLSPTIPKIPFLISFNFSPLRHFLLALALFDSAFLIFAVLELSLPIPLDGQHLLISVHTRFVLFIRMFASAFYKASILIVVAFNVERYLYVCRPLWVYRSGILEKRACCVVVMALVIGLLCSIQWPLAWRVVELECNEPCEKEEIENNCFNVNKTQVVKYSIVVVKESLILQYIHFVNVCFRLNSS
uniref:G-protein coupled receptors family 1 profile domain-containing protein n=1 Tax=Meloidogyne incognita TaxID=6306 RepID=A0A914LWT3_MELIC